MNAESLIRELVQAEIVDDHLLDVVRFIDRLLLIASEVGEIQCTLAGDGKLRFQVPGQPAWEMEIGRAKSKLRIFCARLGVLCNESGDQDVSLYGGEGIIAKACPEEVSVGSAASDADANGPPAGSSREGTSRERPPRWAVRFMNTMHEQRFTIQSL